MRRRFTFDSGPTSYHLGISFAHPNILSGGSPGRIRKIAGHLDPGYELVESERGLVTVHGTYKGLPVTAFSTGMGPASVSVTLPEVIEACDDDDMAILRLGTAGGMKQHMRIGDFVVTTWVLREESTSGKIIGIDGYIPASDPLLREFIIMQANAVKQDFQAVHVGPIMVTDDLYFANQDIQEGQASEILAVEMEFSVYCALRDKYNGADGRNIRVGNLLVVSDVLEDKEHTDVTEFQRKRAAIEKEQVRAGLETLVAYRAR